MRILKEDESKKQDHETISRAVESNDIEKQVNEYISNAREEDKDKERMKNNLQNNIIQCKWIKKGVPENFCGSWSGRLHSGTYVQAWKT